MPIRFTIFGFMAVPFRLHATWVVFAVVLAWSLDQYLFPFLVPELRPGDYHLMAFAGCAIYFTSIVLRELTRVLVARALRARPSAVTLHVFGGILDQQGAGPAPRQALALAVAGFGASLVLGAIVALLLLQLVDTRTHLALVALGLFTVLANWLVAILNVLVDGAGGIGRWLRPATSTVGRN